jgi:very-short-patch-repair endonuclease
MRIYYNPMLKVLARQLRNKSTKSEIILWGYLKGTQMRGYDFHRQKPIANYIVDFFCNRLQLAIELDGYSHILEETHEKDKIKDLHLTKLGIRVLRFEDKEVTNNIINVLRAIENYIDEYESKQTPP